RRFWSTPFGRSFESVDVCRTRRVPFSLTSVIESSPRESLTFPIMKFFFMMSVASGPALPRRLPHTITVPATTADQTIRMMGGAPLRVRKHAGDAERQRKARESLGGSVIAHFH